MNAQGVPAENGTLKVPDAREPGGSPEGARREPGGSPEGDEGDEGDNLGF